MHERHGLEEVVGISILSKDIGIFIVVVLMFCARIVSWNLICLRFYTKEKMMSISGTAKRFDWIIDGDIKGPNSLCDIDMQVDVGVAVVPTLGAMVPGWLLAVPRTSVSCAAHLSSKSQMKLINVVKKTAGLIENFGQEAVYFEHGASTTGSLTGCGVDQAHIHVVPLGADFLRFCVDNTELNWQEVDPNEPWLSIDGLRDYYVISNFQKAYLTYPVNKKSQFIRQLVATYIGRPNEWDYKQYPHLENVSETVLKIQGEDLIHDAA